MGILSIQRQRLVSIMAALAITATGIATGIATATGQPAVAAVAAGGQSTVSAVGWQDAALVYTDGPTAEADFRKYLRVDGNPTKAAAYDTLIINDQTAPSTARYEYGPTYATDWDALLNSYATSNGSAGTLVNLRRAAVVTKRTDAKVVLGLPWPDTANSGFRTPTGRVVNLTTAAGRASALTDFVTVAKARFTASGAASAGLKLWGVYWSREDLAYGDASLVTNVTAAVRGQGLRTLWAPYFTAPQAVQWSTLGFDAMSLQPGYAFSTRRDGGDMTTARLTAAVKTITAARAGLTLEIRGAGSSSSDLALLREYLAMDRKLSPTLIRVHFVGMTQPLPLATSGNSPVAWRELTNSMIARRLQKPPTSEATVPVSPDGTAAATLPAEGQLQVTAHTVSTTLAVAEQQQSGGTWLVRGWTMLNPNAEEAGLAGALLPLSPGAAGAGRIRLTRAAGQSLPGSLSVTVSASAPPAVLQALPGVGYQQTGAAPTSGAKYPNQGQLTRSTTPAPGSWTSGEAIGWLGDPARAGVIADLGSTRSVKSAVLLAGEGGNAGVNWPRHVTMLVAGCRVRTTAGAGPLPCAITPLATTGPTGVVATTLGRTGRWTGSGPASGRYLVVTSTLSTSSMWQRLRITATDNTAASFTYALINPASPATASSNYADDGQRLTDGNAGDDLNRFLVTGFPASNAGSVTLNYGTARSVRLVDIWLVNLPSWGVLVPSGLAATVNGTRYAMPCVARAYQAMRCRAVLPATSTTAVNVSWPVAGSSASWVMATEVAAAA